MAEDDSGFLTILLESSPLFWDCLQRGGDLDAKAFIEQLLVFVRAYALLNDSNQLALFAVGSAGSTLLHATPGCAPYALPSASSGAPRGVAAVGADTTDVALRRLQQVMAHDTALPPGGQQDSAMSSAISRALCFVNRFQTAGEEGRQRLPARVLCLAACPDAPAQYIAVMNAIFAAQRSSVIIDACVLGQRHSSFMQQAAHLTGGVYMRPSKPAALVEYLLTAYAAAPSSRPHLRLPHPASVDFRAACFCHKRPTDLAFVCSVCLSIFCSKVPVCTTCGTDFMKGSGTLGGG